MVHNLGKAKPTIRVLGRAVASFGPEHFTRLVNIHTIQHLGMDELCSREKLECVHFVLDIWKMTFRIWQHVFPASKQCAVPEFLQHFGHSASRNPGMILS